MRALLVLSGLARVERIAWPPCVFGALLPATAVKMPIDGGDDLRIEGSGLLLAADSMPVAIAATSRQRVGDETSRPSKEE